MRYLSSDLGNSDGAGTISTPDFSAKELAMIRCTIEDTEEAWCFWASANLCAQLAGWGANVSSFFHSCPLSQHGHRPGKPSCSNCPFKGRMAAKLATGSWLEDSSQELLNLGPGQARTFLQKIEESKRNALLLDYQNCKVTMAQRFLQVFGFWRELPWRICAVGIHLFYTSEDANVFADYVQAPKCFAREILEAWHPEQVSSTSGYRAFHMPRLFLDATYPANLSAYMVFWASSEDSQMPEPLARELMKYCSALTCMQSLEAQHHFINQRVSFGRASLPASTCAYLRRRTNKDVYEPKFRANIGRYINKLSSILPTKCENRAEILQ